MTVGWLALGLVVACAETQQPVPSTGEESPQTAPAVEELEAPPEREQRGSLSEDESAAPEEVRQPSRPDPSNPLPAGVSPSAGEPVRAPLAAEYVRWRLRACPGQPPEEWLDIASMDPEWGDSEVSAWSDGVAVLFEAHTFGSGVEGTSSSSYHRVQADDCSGFVVRTGVSDGDYRGTVAVTPPDTPARRVAERLGAELLQPDSSAFGATLLYASIRSSDEAGSEGLGPRLHASQPWFAGRPRAAPMAYDPEAARWYFAIDRPARVRRMAPLELWAAPLRGRNGGHAYVVYDRVQNRHRWLWWSRFTVNATEVHWGPSVEGRLVGLTWSRHPAYRDRDGFIVLDLNAGTAHRLRLPVAWPDDSEDPADSAAEWMRRARIRWTRDGVSYPTAGGRQTFSLRAAPAP